MTINLAIITRFIGVRVGGCGLSRIKAICFFNEAHHISNICPFPLDLSNIMKNHP
jgi:hypothetical protein